MATVTLKLCGEHGKPIVYLEAGYFNHRMSTLYRHDPKETVDGGWCEVCKKEMDDEAPLMGGCMSFLPIQDVDPEEEWEDHTDLLMTPVSGVVSVIVCKCGKLPLVRA